MDHGGGGMMAMQMMPIMMMTYMQTQGENSTLGSWFGINQTKQREDFQQRFNATGDYDPYRCFHHRFFPVPKDVELGWPSKIMYYTPWLELFMVFGILAAVIGGALYFFPKQDEEQAEEEEGEDTTPIEKDQLRAILDAADDDDASKLANLRALIGNQKKIKSSKTDETADVKDESKADETDKADKKADKKKADKKKD